MLEVAEADHARHLFIVRSTPRASRLSADPSPPVPSLASLSVPVASDPSRDRDEGCISRSDLQPIDRLSVRPALGLHIPPVVFNLQVPGRLPQLTHSRAPRRSACDVLQLPPRELPPRICLKQPRQLRAHRSRDLHGGVIERGLERHHRSTFSIAFSARPSATMAGVALSTRYPNAAAAFTFSASFSMPVPREDRPFTQPPPSTSSATFASGQQKSKRHRRGGAKRSSVTGSGLPARRH